MRKARGKSFKSALDKIREFFPDARGPIQEAKEPREVLVSTADRKNGIPKDKTRCALALALARLGNGAYVEFTSAYLITKDNRVIRYSLRELTVREVLGEDRHKDFRAPVCILVPHSPSHSLVAVAMQTKRAKARLTRGRHTGERQAATVAAVITKLGQHMKTEGVRVA